MSKQEENDLVVAYGMIFVGLALGLYAYFFDISCTATWTYWICYLFSAIIEFVVKTLLYFLAGIMMTLGLLKIVAPRGVYYFLGFLVMLSLLILSLIIPDPLPLVDEFVTSILTLYYLFKTIKE